MIEKRGKKLIKEVMGHLVFILQDFSRKESKFDDIKI